MQEGNKACKMRGCALQESITVSFCTGELKLEMTRDYVQLKSVKSLLVWKALIFFWSLYLCKLVEIPDRSSVEIIWWWRINFHLTGFHMTNWKRLSLWGVVGEVGGSKRGRSLVYVKFYGLHCCMHFTMSLLSKIKRILKKKDSSLLWTLKTPIGGSTSLSVQ